MKVRKLTPVLFVGNIEPCVEFWVERLGFRKTVEVPEGNQLGFVALGNGSAEIMYQTFQSGSKDVPALAEELGRGPTFLYVEVEKLNDVIAAMTGTDIFLPERTTFYGAKEIGIRDPAGHLIVFAEMGATP
jgi:uncharacterized glyoxalase superfamily protein PhnB